VYSTVGTPQPQFCTVMYINVVVITTVLIIQFTHFKDYSPSIIPVTAVFFFIVDCHLDTIIIVIMPPPGLSDSKSSSDKAKKKSIKNASRSYPRGVGLDFRKLAGLTLVSYIDHHGACVPSIPLFAFLHKSVWFLMYLMCICVSMCACVRVFVFE
jgi:hypothetical protein